MIPIIIPGDAPVAVKILVAVLVVAGLIWFVRDYLRNGRL